jgi:hypothetical protein
MTKSIVAKPKKRGRPYIGGRDPMTGVRMPSGERQAIEAWGAEQSPPLTFSKAFRQLAQIGLETAAKRAKRKGE